MDLPLYVGDLVNILMCALNVPGGTLHVLDVLFFAPFLLFFFFGPLTTSCIDAIELDQVLCQKKKKKHLKCSELKSHLLKYPKSIISLSSRL